eukprot:3802067-Rhodomonas_salina.7
MRETGVVECCAVRGAPELDNDDGSAALGKHCRCQQPALSSRQLSAHPRSLPSVACAIGLARHPPREFAA